MTNIEGPYSEYRQVSWNPKREDQTHKNPAIGLGYELRRISLKRRYPVGSISLSEPPYTLQEYENPKGEIFRYCSKDISPTRSVKTSMVCYGTRIKDFSFTQSRVINPGAIEHLTLRPRYSDDDLDDWDDADYIFSPSVGVLQDSGLNDLNPILDYTITDKDTSFLLDLFGIN